MKRVELLRTPATLLVEDNILAITSSAQLTTVSSAIHNGGFKKVKAILNIQVPEGYSDIKLHKDPLHLVKISSSKIGIQDDYLAMITAAKISNMSFVAKSHGSIVVNVVATAGASHGESAGEIIDAGHQAGTINIIVVINGSPTDSCLMAAFVTATEAKTAALHDLDIRSRYSGDAATGTITDSLSVATTNTGQAIELGGPASELGQLVASCVREAVKEAVQKQDGTLLSRSVAERLSSRRLSLEKVAFELSKIESLATKEKDVSKRLHEILSHPLYSSFIMAAMRLDDDIKKGLVPFEFGEIANTSEKFGNLILEHGKVKKKSLQNAKRELDCVDLPPFLKQSLFSILEKEIT